MNMEKWRVLNLASDLPLFAFPKVSGATPPNHVTDGSVADDVAESREL